MTTSADVSFSKIAKALNLSIAQVTTTINLLDEGNTVPFITRYRQDQTGGLDEEQIERILAAVTIARQLEQRKQTILRSIESQGKLTDSLRQEIERADHVRRLEDLYLPFKPKKQTLATKAVEQGLTQLADEIWKADKAVADLDARAAEFINEDKGVVTAADALLGAGYILAERFSERADLRQKSRKIFRASGKFTSSKIKDDNKKNDQFRDFLDFKEPIKRVPPHRVMAVNRGEKAGVLRVQVTSDVEAIHRMAVELLLPTDHPHLEFLTGCTHDSIDRLVVPSLERETRRDLTEKAENHAVEVFARNLRKLLLQRPLPGKRVLAMDPGFKSGCKIAALDEYGNLLSNDVVHIIGSDEKKTEAPKKIAALIKEHSLNTIAIGNGTACRETEELVAKVLAEEELGDSIGYIIVNEAGASVYSTSTIGREELPDCKAIERSAISIGRRLQDPLSELVKIDPASIGVGQYQHDTKAHHLKESLDAVVRSCVNYVGVDVNSASPALLRYVSGLNQLTARRLFEHRQKNGPFKNRKQLLEVSGVGEATFTQAAGFLKIASGDNPLDATWVHPESYEAAEKMLGRLEVEPTSLGKTDANEAVTKKIESLDMPAIAGELEIGERTLKAMLESLTKPGRDPRESLPAPIFRKDVVKIEDLQTGMDLQGTVLNVVDFGAFVDIGLHDSGLVHVSQLSNTFVKDPHEIVGIGDQVKVWVTSIDKDRHRVALTMIEPGTETPHEAKPKRGQKRPPKRGTPPPYKRKRDDAKKKHSAHHAKKPSRPHKPRKPVVPITDNMKDGKEPMKTFGDLAQFFTKPEKPKSDKKKE